MKYYTTMCKKQFLRIASLLLIILPIAVFSQSGANSPFSRFGIGDIADNQFMNLRHMGGISAAYADIYQINIQNPASYSFLRATTFEVGVSAKNASISDNENSTGVWSGNLDYISLAFPLSNPLNEIFDRKKRDYWLGMSFSLLPVSHVGYNISSTDMIDGIGEVTNNFRGTGGTYKFLWGNAIRFKEFSCGVNMGYAFGKINYERNVIFNDIDYAYDNAFLNDYSLSGFVWNAGFIYNKLLNAKAVKEIRGTESKILNIGIYGNSNTSFSTKSEVFNRNLFNTLGGIFSDTLAFETDVRGSGTLPAELGIGVMYYYGAKLGLGIDYKFNNWSSYKNDANLESLSNTYKISFGGYYRPNISSFDFGDRVKYRFGMYYGTDPRTIAQKSISNYGVTFGFGLPFVYQRKISHINLGFEIGKRGQKDVLSETFVKLGIGLTFNDDEWFIKRKYN